MKGLLKTALSRLKERNIIKFLDVTRRCCHRSGNNGASGGRGLSLVTSQVQMLATIRRRLQRLPKGG